MLKPAISVGFMVLFLVHAKADVSRDANLRANLMRVCSQETGFEVSDWSQLEDRHFAEPIPTEFKCFINCVYESHGVLRNGEVTPLQEVRVHLSLDAAQWQAEYELLRECGAKSENDQTKRCERGWNIFKCSKIDEERRRGLLH